MWTESKFDQLVQEAIRCDYNLPTLCRDTQGCQHDHTVKVFTRLMLQGKIRAAMRWLTDRSRGHILHPTDQIMFLILGCPSVSWMSKTNIHPLTHLIPLPC